MVMENGNCDTGNGRGKVRFFRRREKPRTPKAMMDTLRTRKLAKISHQLDVLNKITDYNATIACQTRAHIMAEASATEEATTTELHAWSQCGYPRAKVKHIQDMVDAEHDRDVKRMRSERIKAWKSKLQRDDREAFKWLKGTSDMDSTHL